MKFPALRVTRMFITVFTRARHWSPSRTKMDNKGTGYPGKAIGYGKMKKE